MSKIRFGNIATDGKSAAGNGSGALSRRELLIAAGQAAAAGALAGCDGKGMQASVDMGIDMGRGSPDLGSGSPDLRSANPDLRSIGPDMASPPDLAPGIDMRYVCTSKVATGAETLAVNEAQSFKDAQNPSASFIVARDANGFFALRNVCSHAGCQTDINSVAKTYDCPCHLSRFNLDGTVLSGPAISPFKSFPMIRRGDGMLEIDPCGPGSDDLTGRVK